MNPKHLMRNILLFLGITISILVVIALPDFYSYDDIATFWSWAYYWNTDWRTIYETCTKCNYPIIGMITSAGVIGQLTNLGPQKAIFIFRILLSLVDGANVWLLFWLFRKFSVRGAAFWAGVTGISLSSWVPGALWGQIDGIDQLLIMLLLVLITWGNLRGPLLPRDFRVFVIISSILIASLLMTKQLALFSVFTLGLLLLASIVFYSRISKASIFNIGIAAAFFLVVLFAFDPFLKMPRPYSSNLYYIWIEGSKHADVISGNGFNLWMFLGRDMWSSSHVPIFPTLPWFTPYGLGLSLFVAFTLITFLSLFLFLRNRFDQSEHWLNAELLLNFIFYLALVNLSFNIFLTGTHERYLFHFYPYIILAWAGLRAYSPIFNKKVLLWLVLGANVYGLFVLQILAPIDFGAGYRSHWLVGAFQLALLVFLTWQYLKYQAFLRSLAALWRTPGKQNLDTS